MCIGLGYAACEVPRVSSVVFYFYKFCELVINTAWKSVFSCTNVIYLEIACVVCQLIVFIIDAFSIHCDWDPQQSLETTNGWANGHYKVRLNIYH